MKKVLNFVIAVVLTLITILISYKASEEITNIVNQSQNTKKEAQSPSVQNISESNTSAINISKNDTTAPITPTTYTPHAPGLSNLPSEKVKINYSLLEEAHIFDFCIIKENEQFFEGGASICLNKKEPYKFLLKEFENKIYIQFSENVGINYTKKDEILIGFAYAKNFKGVEGIVKNVFSNSSEIKVGNFYFGERYFEKYLAETYLIFPIYITKIANSTAFIFVETDLKNYLIGKIEIEIV